MAGGRPHVSPGGVSNFCPSAGRQDEHVSMVEGLANGGEDSPGSHDHLDLWGGNGHGAQQVGVHGIRHAEVANVRSKHFTKRACNGLVPLRVWSMSLSPASLYFHHGHDVD